jgi:Cft2 family RNA processing exonuclease
MHGLEDNNFFKLLKSNSNLYKTDDDRKNDNLIKFYVSSITKKFIGLCDKYKHLHEFCTELSCDQPISVNLNQNETISITFIGSGHCPGSVMVFIEGARGNILFTGDFRLPLTSASRLKFLKLNQTEKEKKCVHTLYIDMTFFTPAIKSIPTREESVCELIKFIKKTLDDDKKTFFYLKTSARIGYEYVYTEIYNNLKQKVHVNETIYRLYDNLPQIQQVLTLDPYETQIHSCMYEVKKRDEKKISLFKSTASTFEKTKKCSNLKLPCTIEDQKEFDRIKLNVNCIKIILSTMWFIDTAGVSRILLQYVPSKIEAETAAYKPYRTVYRLCYSFHSSYEEIVDFVETIKPQNLKVIALPESTSELDVNKFFYGESIIKKQSLSIRQSESISNSSLNSLVLRKRKSTLDFNKSDSETDTDDEDDDLCFGLSDKIIKIV